MQRIGREVAAVLLAQRAVSAGAAMQQQQQAMPALLQQLGTCLCCVSSGMPLVQQVQQYHSSSNSRRQPQQSLLQALRSPSTVLLWRSRSLAASSTQSGQLLRLGVPHSSFLFYHSSSSSSSSSSSLPSPAVPAVSSPAAAQQAPKQHRPAAAQQAPKPRIIEGICRRKGIKLGWKKLDFVLRMVRRSYVDDAMAQLANNPKKSAVYVMHAIANARNNAIVAGGDPGKLWVAEAFVTKGQYQKRVHFMSKGYASFKEARQSHLNVRVRQLDEADPAAAKMLRQRPKLVTPLMDRMQRGRLGRRSRQMLQRPPAQRLFAPASSA